MTRSLELTGEYADTLTAQQYGTNPNIILYVDGDPEKGVVLSPEDARKLAAFLTAPTEQPYTPAKAAAEARAEGCATVGR